MIDPEGVDDSPGFASCDFAPLDERFGGTGYFPP